jgi:hypothetical protein
MLARWACPVHAARPFNTELPSGPYPEYQLDPLLLPLIRVPYEQLAFKNSVANASPHASDQPLTSKRARVRLILGMFGLRRSCAPCSLACLALPVEQPGPAEGHILQTERLLIA